MSEMAALDERFWAKVQGADVTTCWLWTGAGGSTGYGRFTTGGRAGLPRCIGAHRYAYIRLRADIPEGLHLDHLCRVRACVNPWHLEPVTARVNRGRAAVLTTLCPKGHPYDQANTYVSPDGSRQCRICRCDSTRRRRQKLTAELLANPEAAPHGVLDTYNTWGCRCRPCRAAYMTWRHDWEARRHV